MGRMSAMPQATAESWPRKIGAHAVVGGHAKLSRPDDLLAVLIAPPRLDVVDVLVARRQGRRLEIAYRAALLSRFVVEPHLGVRRHNQADAGGVLLRR